MGPDVAVWRPLSSASLLTSRSALRLRTRTVEESGKKPRPLRSKIHLFVCTTFKPFPHRMQRRAGRGQAHISLSVHNTMASDSEKPSRFGHRNFGVTNRIWVVILLLIFILSCTHFIWPIGSGRVVQNYSNADVKAKNYFNATEAGPNPFAFCPVYGPGDELGAKHGAHTLSKSVIHPGSGARIQRVLNQALAGQPVTISVLGGSSEWFV